MRGCIYWGINCGIIIHNISYHLYAMDSREIVNHEGLTMVSHVGLTYGCHEGHTIIMSHHMGQWDCTHMWVFHNHCIDALHWSHTLFVVWDDYYICGLRWLDNWIMLLQMVITLSCHICALLFILSNHPFVSTWLSLTPTQLDVAGITGDYLEMSLQGFWREKWGMLL